MVTVAVEDAHLVVDRGHPGLPSGDPGGPVADSPGVDSFDPSAEGLGNGLMAEAHPERGGPGGIQITHQVQ